MICKPELTVAAERVQQLRETLKLDEHVPIVALVQSPQNVDTGSVDIGGGWIPACLTKETSKVESQLQGLACVGEGYVVVVGRREFSHQPFHVLVKRLKE